MIVAIRQPGRTGIRTLGLPRPAWASVRNVRRVSMSLSLIAVALMVNIIYDHLVIRDEVPVFHAMEGPLWHRPAEQGGVQAKFTGFALNRIISGRLDTETTPTLTLAPPQPGLPAEVLSPRELRALQRGVAAPSVAGTSPVGTVAPTGESSVTGEVQDGINIESLIAEIIGSQSEAFTGLELLPETVLSGTVTAQVGIFSEREQAANRLIELLNSFPDSLGSMDWMIEPFILGNRRSHRLRFLGFAQFDDAMIFCQKLVSRGVQCVPTLVF